MGDLAIDLDAPRELPRQGGNEQARNIGRGGHADAHHGAITARVVDLDHRIDAAARNMLAQPARAGFDAGRIDQDQRGDEFRCRRREPDRQSAPIELPMKWARRMPITASHARNLDICARIP